MTKNVVRKCNESVFQSQFSCNSVTYKIWLDCNNDDYLPH